MCNLRPVHPLIRLDHQPLFGKGARAPPPLEGCSRGGTRTRHERAAEIEPIHSPALYPPGVMAISQVHPLYAGDALFLRLGVPSTLICHENGTFRKRSSIWNLKTLALRVILQGKHFDNENTRKQLSDDNHEISCQRFPQGCDENG